jgi:hypothetical protein
MSGAETSIKAAAILFVFTGLGFGVPCVMGIRSLLAGRGILMLFGFPTYGGGLFERYGIKTTAPLLFAFLVVCALEIVAGVLVWQERLAGAILGIALLPIGLVFWLGFSLPIPPPIAIVRTILVLLQWRRFS